MTTLAEQHAIVHERIFHIAHPSPTILADMISSLCAERITGKLTIHIAQGGLRCAEFEERTKISIDTGELFMVQSP